MNLGTLFSKPGESSYSIYRRFLISNHTINYEDLTGNLRKHFTEVFGSEFSKNTGWISIAKKILMLEGKKNKRLPSSIKHLGEKEPLLFNTQWYYTTTIPSELILSDMILDELVLRYRAIYDLNCFFRKAYR